MQIIVKELRKAIFCLSKEVIDKIEELTHQSIFTAEKNTVTYFELTNLLINHIEKTKHEKIEYMEQERKNSEALKKGFFERETELQNEINDKDSVYSSKIRRLEYEIRELNDQVTQYNHIDFS